MTDQKTPAFLFDLAACFALAALLYFQGVGNRDLAGADEPRYAEVAREMIAEGRWFVPILNGETYIEKPPLYMWLLRVPAAVQGEVTPGAARGLSALFAAAAVAFACGIGWLLGGRFAGWMTALTLATTYSFGFYAQRAVMDAPLAAFTTAALFGYVAWTRAGMSPKRMQLLCYAAMGLGFLMKGPFGILLPAAVMIPDALMRHGAGALRAPHLKWGPALTAGIVALWLVPAAIFAEAGFLELLFQRHVVTRAVSAAAPHAEPFYYYLFRLPLNALPWLLMAPAAVTGTRRCLRSEKERYLHDGLRFSLLWMAAMFVALSLVSSKRVQYLLPLYPGFALWIGLAMEHYRHSPLQLERPEFHRVMQAVSLLAGVAAGLLALGAFLLPWVSGVFGSHEALVRAALGLEGRGPAWWLLAIAALVGAAAWLVNPVNPLGKQESSVQYYRINIAEAVGVRVLVGLTILAAGAILLVHVKLQPAGAAHKSYRAMGAAVAALREAGGETATYGLAGGGALNFYAKTTRFRDLAGPAEIASFLAEPGPRFLAVQERVWRNGISKALAAAPEAVFAHPESKHRVLLLANAAGKALFAAKAQAAR